MSSSPSYLRSLLRASAGNKDASRQTGLEMTQHSRTAVVQQQGGTSTSLPSAGAGYSESGAQPHASMPIPMHQSAAGKGAAAPSRCDSAELPSALGTPPRAPGCLGGGQDCAEFAAAQPASSGPQQQQQQQHQDAEAVAPRSQQVTWQLPAAPAPGSCPPAAAAASSSSTPPAPAPQQDGGPSSSVRQQDLAGSSREVPPVGGRAGRAASLPASDDPQLDSYLRYLLKEQHPHSQLYYPGWGLTENGCAAIGEFLRRDRRIKVVTLNGNSINDEGVGLIAAGLAQNSTLLSLDLSDNHVSSVGAIDLAEALHSDKCKIGALLLSNNRIGDDGADALAAAVASSSSLKKLKLSGNPISAAQLEVVQHVLKTREYRLSAQRASSRGRQHLRKDSSVLQFDIELMEGQPRNSSSANGHLSRRSLLRLPTAMAVAALVEAKDPLESSIGMQAAHLLAELQDKARQGVQPAPASSVIAAGAGPAASAPADGGPASEPSLAVMLGLRLACRGYGVVLRTCFPSLDSPGQQEAGVEGKQQAAPELMVVGLRHTFVRVSQPVPAEEAVVLPTVIVDPVFRESFEMPHPTPRLQEALEALPRVLCLAEARLFHLVDLLCSETATAFKQAKLSLPPWRHTPAVMDKWLSTNYHDVVVEADSLPQALELAIHSASAPNPPQ